MGAAKITSEEEERVKVLSKEGKGTEEIAHILGRHRTAISRAKGRLGIEEEGSEVEKWIKDNPKVSEAFLYLKTRHGKLQYAGSLKKYCEWRELNPIELLEEAYNDLDKKPYERVAKAHVARFREELIASGKASKTVSVYLTAIKSFFGAFDIEMNGKSVKISVVNKEENNKHEFTIEEIKKLLDVCSIRDTAIFLVQFQSGLAVNELSNLRIKDIGTYENGKVEINQKDGIIPLHIKREKTNNHFHTFIGNDGRNAVEEWLRFRNSGNIFLDNPEVSEQAKVESGDDFLFVSYDRKRQKWGKLTTITIAKVMREYCRKLGWIDTSNFREEGRFNPFRPHALRMSFSSILKNAYVPWYFVEEMLGHRLTQTDRAYFNINEEKLFEAYKRAETLLSVSRVEEKITDEKYKELKEELQKRSGYIAELQSEINAQKEEREKEKQVREKLTERIEAMEGREDARAPYDDKMSVLMKRLIANPEMKELIKKELGEIKDEKH